MKQILYVAALLLLQSCQTKNASVSQTDTTDQALTSIEISQRTFYGVDSLLQIDHGKFWGSSLNNPLILIDPETRVFLSNKNNTSETFKKYNNYYTDTLPNHLNISNTSFKWDDQHWSMVMLPLPTEQTARNTLVIHELFHQIQDKIGFDNLLEQNNGHLDTYEGRVLLTLELEALKNVISSSEKATQDLHLTNALAFRSRRQWDEQKKMAENSLELNEGLAEYTAIMLSGRNKKEMNAHLINSVNLFYDNPTFVRSFAYQTIPLYGYLLSQRQKEWHLKITKHSNLTQFFTNSFGLESDTKPYQQIALENDYHYHEIVEKERIREEKRLEKIEKLKTKFLQQPTLKLSFENMNISFDPRNITPLEDFGTVYPNIRVTDNWGILTVENEALIDSNWGSILVSEPTEINLDIAKGDGWILELAEHWTIEKEKKSFVVKKE